MNLDDLDVCKVFFEDSVFCTVAYVAFWSIVVTYGGYAIVSLGRKMMRTMTPMREKCPKCKKGFLKEESRDRPEIEPGGKKHTYRDFYLVCQNNECDHKEKIGKSELVA